eukprot:765521-Hanusia_phi.AAC.4
MAILSRGIHRTYEVGRTLGKGSFATVKEGKHRDKGTRVAIKIVDKWMNSFHQSSLEQEIQTMMKVSHPNCIRLHEVYDQCEKTYLILDLATGGTVMDRIIALDFFSEKQAAKVTGDVLNAVEYLHNIGITHRDLKPENLLYASNDPNSKYYDTVKVADFGLSKYMGHEDVSMKTTCGTPNYMAPEVLDSDGFDGYGPEVDIWSVGVILYTMLCGFQPFFEFSTAALFQQIMKAEYSFPSPYWDQVSQEAKHLISKMLVVDRSKRLTAKQCLNHIWFDLASSHDAVVSTLHGSLHAFLLIRKLPVFDNIDPKLQQEVINLLKPKQVPCGEHVIQSGEVADCMYFIQSGSVSVMVDGSEIDRLHAGDFFGEVALTVSELRTADVISLGAKSGTRCKIPSDSKGPTELLQLMRSDFEQILAKFPVLQSRMVEISQSRVRRAISARRPSETCSFSPIPSHHLPPRTESSESENLFSGSSDCSPVLSPVSVSPMAAPHLELEAIKIKKRKGKIWKKTKGCIQQ